MGPDLRFHFLKYGPLTMYAISGIYRVVAALRGESALEYASRVFFEGSEHYVIARVYTIGWLSVLAVAAFFQLKRQLGRTSALLACTLLAFPFVDVLLEGARIDVPQAAFQGLALLALTEVVVRPRISCWLIAGACAGLAVASKPLPGLLILPSFVLASWFAAAHRGDGTPRPLLARLRATLASRGLWMAALACALCAVLGDPELMKVGHFIESQRAAIELHSGDAPVTRASIAATFSQLGWPFLVLTALCAPSLFRDPRSVVIGFFVATYIAAFMGRASRHYFMVAPAAALCLLAAYGWARVVELLELALSPRRLSRRWSSWLRWACVPVAGAIIWKPATSVYTRSLRVDSVAEVNHWIEANVPPGTRLLHIGVRPSGTYLVTTSERIQGWWGDHFQYGRHKYPFFSQAFHLGYRRYAKSGKPRYSIEAYRDAPLPLREKRNPSWLTKRLVTIARKKHREYIIVSGYRVRTVAKLDYPWFREAVLEKEVPGFAIFRVPHRGQTAPASLTE
jgi:hypothetical protein